MDVLDMMRHNNSFDDELSDDIKTAVMLAMYVYLSFTVNDVALTQHLRDCLQGE
mgnify:CR=1 FL=1